MDTRIVAADAAGVGLVAGALRAGEVVGLATETVYGLAGALFEPAALARIFEVKERPRFDPLIVHIAAPESGEPLAALRAAGLVDWAQLSEVAQQRLAALVNLLWPGPLTLVVPKLARVPDVATAGLATVAVRMPRHLAAQAVLQQAGVAVAAPSANRFGRISPTSAADVLAELGGRIPLILDGGPCEVGLESTVLAVEPDGTLRLLRPGGVTVAEIAAAAGVEPLIEPPRPLTNTSPEAPGMLPRHYAPGKPMWLLPLPLIALNASEHPWLTELFADQEPKEIALLTFGGPAEANEAQRLLTRLAPQGAKVRVHALGPNLAEAAQRFFATLREMDASRADILLAEPPPPPHTGLAAALYDRLKRASTREDDDG